MLRFVVAFLIAFTIRIRILRRRPGSGENVLMLCPGPDHEPLPGMCAITQTRLASKQKMPAWVVAHRRCGTPRPAVECRRMRFRPGQLNSI
jgi:hypothetical protein